MTKLDTACRRLTASIGRSSSTIVRRRLRRAHQGRAAATRSCIDAEQVLRNMDHRGACGCEAEHRRRRGHSHGAAARVPREGREARARRRAPDGRASSPPATCSCRPTRPSASAASRWSHEIIAEQGQTLVGWRRCRRDPKEADIGPTAHARRAADRAARDRRRPKGIAGDAFERKLYLHPQAGQPQASRRRVAASGEDVLHLLAVDDKVIIYKGMLTTEQLFRILSRTWTTPTTPATWRWCTRGSRPTRSRRGTARSRCASWPQRRDQHAPRQHELDAGPRRASLKSELFGDDLHEAVPDRRARLQRLGHVRQRAGVPAA